MDSIGGKWKLPILCSLTANGTSRYNDLLRNVRGISNTMLSKTLKELEQSRLVRRAEYMEVPIRVEYELTERAKNLQPILLQLIQWEAVAQESNQ
jgi:DNA-binding HxlR family transcriptional regulator